MTESQLALCKVGSNNAVRQLIVCLKLLQGWPPLQAYGFAPAQFDWEQGKYEQPVFVLSPDKTAVNIPAHATRLQKEEILLIAKAGSFDHDFYLRNNPDALAFDGDLISHKEMGLAKGYTCLIRLFISFKSTITWKSRKQAEATSQNNISNTWISNALSNRWSWPFWLCNR